MAYASTSSKDKRQEYYTNGELELRPLHYLEPLKVGSRVAGGNPLNLTDNKILSQFSLWVGKKICAIRNWNLRSALNLGVWLYTTHPKF